VTWNVAQSVSAAGSTGLTLTSPAFTSNLTSGSKLIAWVTCTSSLSISTVKDSNGNSFSQVLAYTASANQFCWIYVLDTPAGDAGTTPTVTATYTGTNNGCALLVQEVTGLATGSTAAAVLDGTAGEANGTGTVSPFTVTWGAYSSAVASEYLTGFYGDDGDTAGTNNTTPTGFTADTSNISNNGSNDLRIYYKNSTGGTESISNLSPTQAGSSCSWTSVFVAFKLAAAGGAPPARVQLPLFRGRAAARKGTLASIQIKPPATGGPPATFYPPHGLLRGAAAAVRGKLASIRGRAGQPSGSRPPGSPLRGPAAARPGRLTGLAAPPPVLHPAVVSPFKAPAAPLRGPAAARPGRLTGLAAPPPVLHPNVPAPFFAPHGLLRGRVPVPSRTPSTHGTGPPPPPPPVHPPHWQGSTHMPAAGQAGNLIQGANHTGTGGAGDLKGDYERSGD